ncbi:MAG: hypothetical protein COX57_01305 [Alphaproteobacteria bacterium CG_4_10_14_0_2_um_filter_63_37]|nr:MAG: hypothetical protein AUJ55_01000 [Proteobacteria bacterium CG1_02_64_396]PJA25796.1 MAG: hypothetical protein COX57_01305 [Alphaproteobacteria bacterium CG_4_10_14_0_2_um_filter_63_37]
MTATFLQSLIALFAVIDPLSGAALFAAMTPDNTANERTAMARRAALTVFGVLTVFLLFGAAILAFFSITIPAFQIAGGLVVGIMALDLLKATQTGVKSTPEERREGVVKTDVSITPLAVPMLAGPGAVSTVMLLTSRHPGTEGTLMLLAAVGLVALIVWVCLRSAARLVKLLGQTGINVVSRLIGLIVLAVAVQFVIDGVAAVLPMFRGVG